MAIPVKYFNADGTETNGVLPDPETPETPAEVPVKREFTTREMVIAWFLFVFVPIVLIGGIVVATAWAANQGC